MSINSKLNKNKAQEAILRTYDLFQIPRPRIVMWYTDIFEGDFNTEALHVRNRKTYRRGSSVADRAAYALRLSKRSSSHLSYSPHWYNIDFPPYGEDEHIYARYFSLLVEATDYGAGYRIQVGDRLLLAPTPIVSFNAKGKFHSAVGPAIWWPEGRCAYFLEGEWVSEPDWQRIVEKEYIGRIDTDPITKRLKELRAVLIDTGVKGNRLYRCRNYRGTGETEYCLVMKDASTDRMFIKFVPPAVGRLGDADLATAAGYKDAAGNSLSLDQYLMMEQEG